MQCLNYECHYYECIITGQTHEVSAQFLRNTRYSLYTMVFLSKTKNHEANFFYTYSSNDNFLSPITVSDCLVFCCGNLTLHQEKRNKYDKNRNFMIKIKKSLKKI